MDQQEKLAEQTDRVYSVITIKEMDEDKREFTGIATTPATDRMGDIVESDGATYKLPIPLLWQHDRSQPVGHVTSVKVQKDKIVVKGTIAKVDSPPGMKARLEEAWQSVKHSLVRGLSIGFAPQEYSFMDSGGIHFTKWDWLELSLVTVPANAQADILTIKSCYENPPAPMGKKAFPVARLTKAAGVSATKPKPKTPEIHMNIEEQIKGYKATRAEKAKEMEEIMEKSSEAGETLDAEQSERYDTLEGEVEAIDKHLARLGKMQKANEKSAEPIGDRSGMQDKTKTGAIAKVKENLAPGTEFARFAMCLGAAKGDLSTAAAIAEKRFPNSERVNIALKAAVSAGTTTDANWALPLVEYNQFAGDFVEFLRPQTILGKFGQNGIPSLRAIPFNVHIRGQTSGGAGYWVGQGAPKPLTKADFNDVYLGYAKVANIAVLTEELLRFSNPSAEMLVRDTLAAALIERLDTDFLDPTKIEVANVSPASITNGVNQIQASGTGTADDIRADVKALMSTFIAANITPASGVWAMSATTALSLSLMRNALGQKEFPDISMMGGRFEGLPVIVSEYIAADSDGAFVYLINASDIWLADDGNVVVDASREASLQMLDSSSSGEGAPTNNSSTGTATTMVSMFQTNSVAIRAERWINWKKRRSAAVAVLAGAHWGE